MQNKAPQGKQDPIPTPESELEQYGVWVKAEPHDIVEEPVAGKLASISRSEFEVVPILPSEDDTVIDSFDFDDSRTEGIEELEALAPADDSGLIEDLSGEIESFDLEALEQVDVDSFSAPLAEDNSEDSALDVTLDELEFEEPAENFESDPLMPPTSADNSFDTTDVNLDDFEISDSESIVPSSSFEALTITEDSTEKSVPESEPDAATDDFESLDIDLQFDDTIPADNPAENSDDYASSDISSIDVTADFESVDLDAIGLNPTSADISAQMPVIEEMATELKTEKVSNISMDSFIDLDESDTTGIIPDMELENVALNDDGIGFDDVQAVSDSLSNKGTEPSSDLLQKIVLELSSIKEELVSLRGQLSSLKTSNQPMPSPEDELEVPEEGSPGGFFDEEDDDTIALTGDELDNILNTADFTEEVATDESLDEPSMSLLQISDDVELLPEDGIYETKEPGIEAIELPTIISTPEEFESLSTQEGVTPITNLSEDTSFLDSTDDEFNLELEMPLVDVPLVEPNSTDLDSIIDSALDIEDIGVADLNSTPEQPEPEIILDFDSDDEAVISTVDSFPEPLEEIEDALELEEFVETEDLGGLELLAEESELEELEELSSDEDSPSTPIEEFESLVSPSVTGSDAPTPPEENLHERNSDVEAEQPKQNYPSSEMLQESDEAPAPSSLSLPSVAETALGEHENQVPDKLKHDVKSVLLYLDQLLASLPEEKIEEFASSEYYDTYKRLFDDLGLL